MRPRRAQPGGGDAGLLKNVFFLLSISGIFYYFFYIGNQSVSGYVPRLELVTDIDDTGGGGSSTSEDYYDYSGDGEDTSPHSADRAVLERYLDEKTETIQRDAREAIEEAARAKEEAEQLKLEMVKVKEEASDERKKQQTLQEKEKAKKLETEKSIQRDVQKAKEEAQKAKAEAEKLKLEVAQAKKEAEEAREQQTKREEKAKLESEKLKQEIAQAKEDAAKFQLEAEEEAATRAQEKENTKRKESKRSKEKEEDSEPKEEEEDAKVVDENTPDEKVETDDASTSQTQKESGKNKESGKKAADDTQKEETTTSQKQKDSRKDNSNKPLNVIVLYPDDWGGRDLQDVNPTLKTPTFSQLAKEGIRFPFNAVTTSICWISRAALFTGQYVSSHKSMYLFRPTFTRKENWAHSWPHTLQKDGGYYVGHIGKWQYRDTGNLKSLFNWSSFFEGWTVMIDRKMGNRTYNAELARDETFRFLRERPKDKPFAATVAFYPPKGIHKVMEVKPELAALYTNMTHPEAYDRAMAYSRLPPFLQDNETLARDRYLYRFETHGDFQETIAAQYATLTHIDTMCGEIIQELKRQGVYDNTMIIVSADNGEFHGAHALADKWYPYSESIHVPLIIKDPRMPKKKRGKLDDSFTLNIDLAETILGAAGLDPPKEMEGRDISDLYLDKPKSTKPWRDEFYYDFPQVNGKIPASYAIVRKDWKYISWYMHSTEELFNMKEDPFELNNVANNSNYVKLKAKLKHKLQVMRHNAYYPRVPDSRCDPLQPSGGNRASMPNCSQVFPDRCCPHWFNDQMI